MVLRLRELVGVDAVRQRVAAIGEPGELSSRELGDVVAHADDEVGREEPALDGAQVVLRIELGVELEHDRGAGIAFLQRTDELRAVLHVHDVVVRPCRSRARPARV